MSGRIDQASRVVGTPPATVYAAFTSGEVLMSWLPPKGMTGQVFEFDFREGGGYRMRLTLDNPGDTRGKTSDDADDVNVRFVKITPPSLLVQEVTFDSDDPEFAGVMTMTWTFREVQGGTDVRVSAMDVPQGITPQDHQAGLESTLDNLARYAERGSRAES